VRRCALYAIGNRHPSCRLRRERSCKEGALDAVMFLAPNGADICRFGARSATDGLAALCISPRRRGRWVGLFCPHPCGGAAQSQAHAGACQIRR